MDTLNSVDYLVVHHSQRHIDFPWLIRTRHKYLRGWEEIGYHYLIGNGVVCEDGKLYKGRDESFQGAHVRGLNNRSIGICLIGDMDRFEPTEKQMSTLLDFLTEKLNKHNIPVENIIGHREFNGVVKTCPGLNIDLNFIRKELEKSFIYVPV